VAGWFVFAGRKFPKEAGLDNKLRLTSCAAPRTDLDVWSRPAADTTDCCVDAWASWSYSLARSRCGSKSSGRHILRREGDTPLHSAVDERHPEVARLLHQYKADRNTQDVTSQISLAATEG